MKRARSSRVHRKISCFAWLWLAGLALSACSEPLATSDPADFRMRARAALWGSSSTAGSPPSATAKSTEPAGTRPGNQAGSASSGTSAAVTPGTPLAPGGTPLPREPARTKTKTPPPRPSRVSEPTQGRSTAAVRTGRGGEVDEGLLNGSECRFDYECESEHCTSKVCRPESYREKSRSGVDCVYNSDCESDYCSRVCK
jgi:hypothetical protein